MSALSLKGAPKIANSSSDHLLPPVPVVVVAGACAGFFAAGAGVLVVAGAGCFSEVLVTACAAVG